MDPTTPIAAGAGDPQVYCEDCQMALATRVFLHFYGREYDLCEECFYYADHSEDYLNYCRCEVPEAEEGVTHCDTCRGRILPPVPPVEAAGAS